MSNLYPNVDVYTEQLRALEGYRNENPKVAEGRFLLAYHYTTGGHDSAAASELKAVAQLQPKDELSTQLLKALAETGDAVPAQNRRRQPQRSRADLWQVTVAPALVAVLRELRQADAAQGRELVRLRCV